MIKSNSNSRSLQILRSANLYRTKCRVAILKVLTTADRPLSHNEIAKRLGKNHFDKVTIYRTLESFICASLVHKAFLQKKTWHFELADKCTEHQCHPHFTCTNCNRTHCMTELSLPMPKSPHKGFIIDHQRIQLEGLCPRCKPGS